MRYLGGKAYLAKRLVAAMRAEQGGLPVWEPFCGGLSMTAEFAKRSTGVASDAHPALMAMYAAVQCGWVPPEHVTKEEYELARHLPDTDPFKAFIGFGCSFGGKWFGGYARGVEKRPGYWRYLEERDFCGAAKRSALTKITATASWQFMHASFFDFTPCPLPGFIYCDPPYEGTTGYKGVVPFDHGAFWYRCQEWAEHVPVYVSEFSCRVSADVVLEIPRKKAVVGGNSGSCVDTLYRVHPLSKAQAA